MAKKDKKLWIDMCAGSELKDTQGETLSVEGANIDDLEAGKGRFNDNHGKGFFNSLGRVTEAKKIFKSEDCENERHTYYWEKIKAPYVYCKGYLYSDEDHSNAKAAAAILRNIHREDAPLAMKASVEGGVLSRGLSDPTRLAQTKIHSVALTFTPANNATLVEPLNMDKSSTDWEADKQLIKSVMHLAETNVPSFRHVQRHASAHLIHDNMLKIQELAKSLGIEIEIKGSTPEEILQQAVLHKVASSVYKIKDLVKAASMVNAMKPTPSEIQTPVTATSPGKVKMASAEKQATKLTPIDKFQQGIGKLKTDSNTPTKPKSLNDSSNNMKVTSAHKAKYSNILKGHASKAMKDPKYLDGFRETLHNSDVHPDKADKIIGKIKSHMLTKSSDDMEKGDGTKAVKNLLLAGVMTVGANSMSPKKLDPAKTSEQKMSRENKIHAHNEKIKDPEIMINSEQYGYDQSERNSKKKFHARRKKAGSLKNMLKKALTAGYGGAGAPTSLTGGGVMQSEALDDGRGDKGMGYIVCENCGKEQVFMEHQVKCRDCKKNFSLDKLQDHL